MLILITSFFLINILHTSNPKYGTRINASIYSIILSILSISSLYQYNNKYIKYYNDKIYQDNELYDDELYDNAKITSIISLSYLITDTFHHIIYKTITLQDIIHHSMMSIAIIYSFYLQHYWYLLLGITSEITGPCLHYCYYCNKENNKKNIYFKISSILLLLFYFVFRIINFGYISYASFNGKVYGIFFSMFMLFIINCWWFNILINKAWDVYFIRK